MSRYFQLCRVRSSLGAPLLSGMGWWLGGRGETYRLLGLVCVSSFTMMCFAQIFNDVRDQELDRQAMLRRPLVTGEISVKRAWALAFACVFVSFVAAMLASRASLVVDLLCLLGAWAYSLYLKGVPVVGNVTVAVVSASTLLYAHGIRSVSTGHLAVGFGIVSLYMFGCEVFKTSLDAESDAMGGVKTLATQWGSNATRVAIAVTWAMLTVVVGLGVCVAPRRLLYVVVVAIVVVIPTCIGGAIVVRRANSVGLWAIEKGWGYWRLAWYPGFSVLFMLKW